MTPHDLTLAGYAVIVACVVALEAAAARHLPGVVSIRTVLGRIMRTRAGRIGVLASWAWLGMHFFAR
ncbi:MAG: DUF6186 family protein [Actinomycetes bacterium]